MKQLITIILSLFIVTFVYPQKVTTDMDKTADFSKYKSFQFLGWQQNSDSIINDLDKERLRKAFKSEFDARKLEKKDSGADMAISLYIVVNQETSVSAYTDYHGTSGYGYRRAGWGWGSGYSTTTYNEYDYLKGTLVMDVYDTNTKEMIWQGVATGTIQEKPEKRDKSIPKTVSKLMKKFPIQKAK
jgi:hypothetical protein